MSEQSATVLNRGEAEHVCAVISSLSPGGAEYTFLEIVALLVRRGKRVTVVTILPPEEGELSLPDGVERVSCFSEVRNASGVQRCFALMRVLKKLRQKIFDSSPHLIVSFMTQTNVLALLASLGLSARKIVCERIHPNYAPMLGSGVSKPLLRFFRNTIYLSADRITVQSETMRGCFPSWLRKRVVVIPNFVRSFSRETNETREKNKVVLTVGRFVSQKNHSLAIRAFARCLHNFPDWRLQVVGAGPERGRLLSEIERLQCSSHVSLLPLTSSLAEHYRSAAIFLSCSQFEGFPNVVLEAMSFSLPVVATDCPGATAELLEGGESGVLVPLDDEDSLVEGLEALMASEEKRRSLGGRGCKRAADFSSPKILPLWDSLLV